MINSALLVLESPWATPKQDQKRKSVLPFLQGLEKILNTFNIYYATFYDNRGFTKALEYDLTKTKENRQILYIAAHGDIHKLGFGTPDVIKNIPYLGEKIEGVMVGSCAIGNKQKIIESILFYDIDKKLYGANWVFSYQHYIDWLTSMLVDLAILENIFLEENRLRSKKRILGAFTNALNIFNPDWRIGEDQKGRKIEIKNAIRLTIRGQGTTKISDRTEDLLLSLHWLDNH